MYKITIGQLITIWVFGLINIAILISMLSENYDVSDFYAYFVFLVTFALIFYTIGWRNYRKKNRD